MAKTSTETTPRTATPPPTIDFNKPFYVTVRQSPTRNIFEVHQGPDAKAAAQASASKAAKSGKVRCAVIGPAFAIAEPPKPAEAELVQLDWEDVDEA